MSSAKRQLSAALLLTCIGLALSVISDYSPALAGESKATRGPEAVKTTGLKWLSDQTAAIKLARAQHKFVLIDIYTNWCEYCKILDNDIASKATLRNYLEREFVCVKVNGEDQKAGSALVKENKITGFPVSLILNQDGEKIGKVTGYTDTNAFIHSLQDITFANDSSAPKNH